MERNDVWMIQGLQDLHLSHVFLLKRCSRRLKTTVYWVIFVVKIFSRMPPIAKIYLVNFFGNE